MSFSGVDTQNGQPYNPPSLNDAALRPARPVFQERAEVLPGNRKTPVCSQKLGSLASVDAALERGSQGLLFDIVKMEERETWTARFLRFGREIGRTDFDGTFLRGTYYQFSAVRRVWTDVCPRQFASQKDASAKRADVDQVRYQT